MSRRMLIYNDLVFSSVPWLSTDQDLRRQGPPESSVDDYTAGYHQDGLLVRAPFGPHSDAILTITARRGAGNDGGEIACAIGSVIYRPEEKMLVQSNPRRQIDREDGA